MDKVDYDKLTWELSKGCNKYHPSKGPHEPEEIYQHFDLERFAEQDKNIERRASSLETLTRQGFDTQRLAAATERENLYYDERQRIIDRTIDDAEHETCKANGIPQRGLVKELDRQEEAVTGKRADNDTKRVIVSSVERQAQEKLRDGLDNGGRRTDVTQIEFIHDVPQLPSKPKDLPETTPAVKSIAQPTPNPKPSMIWFPPSTEPPAPASRRTDQKPIVRPGQTRVVTPATKRDIPGRLYVGKEPEDLEN